MPAGLNKAVRVVVFVDRLKSEEVMDLIDSVSLRVSVESI